MLTYVLDTNVLLHDPKSIFVFEEHEVVVPYEVIREIDKFKKESTGRGQNARTVARYLDKLRQRGDLTEGVLLSGGGKLFVPLVRGSIGESSDETILRTAAITADGREDSVILVTRDTIMRILAASQGIKTEDYRHDQVADPDNKNPGWVESSSSNEDLQELKNNNSLKNTAGFPPNSGVCFRSPSGGSCLALVSPDGSTLYRIPDRRIPKNREQCFAMAMLLSKDIPLITISGPAGTGKTLLALAAGLEVIPNDYQKLLVSRPVIPMGRDLGYLPGTIEEKMSPWMAPIFDNLDFLMPSKKTRRSSSTPQAKPWEELLSQGLLEVEALTYIRGRSIPNQYIIIDEAQNLTPHEVKTILTRAGQGSKIVLTGDPQQIDNPYVESRTNGLSYAIEKFRNSPLAGHISLTKGERSELSEAASRLL